MPENNDRRSVERDHDLLTRIDANLSNFMSRFQDHILEDNQSFKELKERTSRLEKFMWVLLGGILIVEGVFKLILK